MNVDPGYFVFDKGKVKDMKKLMASIQNEFWNKHPDLYEKCIGLIGERLLQIKEGTLSEDEYRATWESRSPEMTRRARENTPKESADIG